MRPRPAPTTVSLVSLLLCGAGVAQQSAPQRPEREVVAVYVYDRGQSRRLFASADRNADDRLDMSEAGACLHTVDGIRDRKAFRRLDEDRDGFLGWREFDAHLRSVLREGGTFYLMPIRRSELDSYRPAGSEPSRSEPTVMERLDTNGDGSVSRAEIRKLLEAAGLPTNLVAQFPVLDRDRSGELSASEVAPLAPLLPQLGSLNGGATGLPTEYRGADRDDDGKVNRSELVECLRVLAPGLERWADKVLQDADSNGNGTLDQQELRRFDKR